MDGIKVKDDVFVCEKINLDDHVAFSLHPTTMNPLQLVVVAWQKVQTVKVSEQRLGGSVLFWSERVRHCAAGVSNSHLPAHPIL